MWATLSEIPLAITFVRRNKHNQNNPCAIREADIHFYPGWDWTNQGPWVDPTKFNVQVVAAHEFGHAMDLDHTTGSLNHMVPGYPFGGYAGDGVHRLLEEEATYLQDHKADSSTGTNLLLSTYTSRGQSLAPDRWAGGPQVLPRSLCPGDPIVEPAIFTGEISANVVGTDTPVAALIRWGIRPAGYGSCSSLTHTLSTRGITLYPNTPAERSPTNNLVLPSSLAPGTYKVCANIRPNPPWAISDLSSYDNAVTHHAWIIDVPTNCP